MSEHPMFLSLQRASDDLAERMRHKWVTDPDDWRRSGCVVCHPKPCPIHEPYSYFLAQRERSADGQNGEPSGSDGACR